MMGNAPYRVNAQNKQAGKYIVLFVACFASYVYADIYFHNPKGSNNRVFSSRSDVRENKRLFNSQNNNRGGYNVGSNTIDDVFSMEYYANSELIFEWTNQHEANGEKTNAQIVLQYMAREDITDGLCSGRTEDRDPRCAHHANCTLDLRYGRHETFESYKHCSARLRAYPFIADQKVQGPTAIYTRQNPKGTRYGYECPEERENYPYKFPTDWVDMAVLTANIAECENLVNESQNIKEKYYCKPTAKYMKLLRKLSDRDIKNRIRRGKPKGIDPIPITEIECKETQFENENFTWVAAPAHNAPKPMCKELPTSRINHNGLGGEKNYNHIKLKLSDVINATHRNLPLVFRIRYFIDTADKTENHTLDYLGLGFTQDQIDNNETLLRGYEFADNPQVNIFEELDSPLQIAFNTDQVGRAFQDRSHTVRILDELTTPNIPNSRVHNINVGGKRGNIVQVYPAHEYRFIPDEIEVCLNDKIHFQWYGSSNNARGSDYNNVVILTDALFETSHCDPEDNSENIHGCASVNVPGQITDSFLGATTDDKWELAVDALESTYFSKLVTVNQVGTFYFVCTRNNDFTNRSQKGKIIVHDSDHESCAATSLRKRDSVKKVEARFHDDLKNFNFKDFEF